MNDRFKDPDNPFQHTVALVQASESLRQKFRLHRQLVWNYRPSAAGNLTEMIAEAVDDARKALDEVERIARQIDESQE